MPGTVSCGCTRHCFGIAYLLGGFAGAPKMPLTELNKIQAVNWPFHKNKEGKGIPSELIGPVIVQGQFAQHGIIMHPAPPFELPASLVFQLNRQYRRFTMRISMNDTGPIAPSPLIFSVYGDDKQLWQSQPVESQEHDQQCAIALKNVNQFKPEVTAGGDIRKAHAVWIDPVVER